MTEPKRSLPMLEMRCPNCNGTGKNYGVCTECKGTGMIMTENGKAILELCRRHLLRDD